MTPFQQGLKYAREMGNAFARERFVAKADVDTTAATRALEKVHRRLDKFTGKHTARLDVTGYGTANAQLTRTARLAERLDRTFTPRIDMDGVPGAIAQVTALDKALDNLEGDRTSASVGVGVSEGGLRQIDRASGRLKLYLQLAAAAGPALVPIGAVAVPALTGLVNLLGGAAVGAGALVVAFQGIGDASKALTEYGLKPTAENAAKLQEAMAGLAPEARSFVMELQAMKPAFGALQDGVAGDFFGNFQGGLTELSGLLPEFQGILGDTAAAAGTAGREILTSLNSDRWAPFLGFVQREAPDAIESLVAILGPAGKGVAELMMAFDPLNNDFVSWLTGQTRDFERWASQLSGSNGFREFVEYIRTSGPQVAGALGGVGDAVLQIVQAAAPLGGPTLAAIEAVARGVALIADSPLGTPFLAAVSAVTLLNAGLKTSAALTAALGAAGVVSGGAAAAGAAGAAGVGTAAAGAAAGAAAAKPKVSAKTVGAIAAVAVAPSVIESLEDLSGGYSGVQTSVESLAGSLQAGTLPSEFKNIADSASLLANRNDFQQWSDKADAALGVGMESVQEANEELGTLDQALAQIGASQGPAAAAAAFDQLASSMGLTAQEAGVLKSQLPDYSSIVGSLSFAELAPGGKVFADIASSIQNTTSEAYQFKASLDAVNAALTGRSSARDYQASLDAATAALKENGKTLNINTERGRANQAALDGIATSALNVASAMKGNRRATFLAGARGDFIEAAKAMGLTEKAAQRLADKLGLVDRTKVNPDVDVNNKRAMAKIEAARAALLGLDRRRADPKADLDDKAFTGAQRKALNDVGVLDKKEANPRADLNDNPFQARRGAVMAALGVTDRFTANPAVNLTDNASGKARSIQASINAIQGKTVEIVVNTFRNVFGGKRNEDGGLYDGPALAFADGGYGVNGRYYARVPQIVPGGTDIRWGEKSTGWEAYISGKPSQRERNISILGEAAQRLGVADPSDALTPAQWGGVSGARRAPSGRGLTPGDVDRIIAAIEGKPPVVVVARSDEQAAELVERLDFELRRG